MLMTVDYKSNKMGIIRFSDGIEIDTSGPLRLLELHDGWYVVGEGSLIPIKDEEEGGESSEISNILREDLERVSQLLIMVSFPKNPH